MENTCRVVLAHGNRFFVRSEEKKCNAGGKGD